jgi:hypothetical protein
VSSSGAGLASTTNVHREGGQPRQVDRRRQHPTSKGAKVRFNGRERTVIDGPFTEAKELVACCWIWECASRDEAIEWLKRVPFDGGVEIELRQVLEAELRRAAHPRAARDPGAAARAGRRAELSPWRPRVLRPPRPFGETGNQPLKPACEFGVAWAFAEPPSERARAGKVLIRQAGV